MATLTAAGSFTSDDVRSSKPARNQASLKRAPRSRRALTPAQAAERARVRTVMAIVGGVFVAAMALAVFILPADLIILGGVGICLTVLLFGLPFWISAVADAAEEAANEADAAARL